MNKINLKIPLFICLLFIIIFSFITYVYAKNTKTEYENKIKSQAQTIDELQKNINNNKKATPNIEVNIDTCITGYISIVETIEKDNYIATRKLPALKKICTATHYKEKKIELEAIDENRGREKSTGGTSCDVSTKEIYIQNTDDGNTYNVIAFSRLVNKTDGENISTALIHKFKVQIEGTKVLVDEVTGRQIINTGIDGIIDIEV